MTAFPITTLRSALKAQFADPIPNTVKLRALAVDGDLPLFQINGRWHFHGEDVDAIGRVLGLSRPAAGEHMVSALRQPVAA